MSMPTLVFSGKLRKNQKRPLVYEPSFKTYYSASRLIDSIMLYVKENRMKVQSKGYTTLEGHVTRVRYR